MSEWKKVRLGDYIHEYSERNKEDADIPVFSVTNSNGFCTEYFSKEVASKDKTTYKIVKKGFFAYNPSRINVGSVDWLRDKNEVIVSPLYNVFSVDDGLDQQYLYYYLKSPIGLYYIKELASGSVRDNLKFSILSEFRIPLPEIKLQKEVAKTLDRIVEIISICNTILETLDLLVKSRFVEMFGEPEINPFNWEQVTVADVCSSIVRGPFGSALKKDFFVEKDETTYKVYEQKHAIQKSATIGTYYVTEEKYNELKRFECVAGDILMSCSGTMGELYQLPVDCEKGIINQALCKFTLNEKTLPIFFLTYMRQTIGNLETKGSGIKNIAAVSYVKAMPINLPPLALQEQFAAFVAQTDKSKYSALKIKENIRRVNFYDQF